MASSTVKVTIHARGQKLLARALRIAARFPITACRGPLALLACTLFPLYIRVDNSPAWSRIDTRDAVRHAIMDAPDNHQK